MKITLFLPKRGNQTGFLTQGTLLFAFPVISQWHNEKYTPYYSGGTVPDYHWIPCVIIQFSKATMIL
jgi:hypothetical protein